MDAAVFFVVLLTLCTAEATWLAAPSETAWATERIVLIVVIILMVSSAVFAWATRLTRHFYTQLLRAEMGLGAMPSATSYFRAYQQIQRSFIFAWLIVSLLFIWAADWPQWLAATMGAASSGDRPPWFAFILALVPTLVTLALGMCGLDRFESAVARLTRRAKGRLSDTGSGETSGCDDQDREGWGDEFRRLLLIAVAPTLLVFLTHHFVQSAQVDDRPLAGPAPIGLVFILTGVMPWVIRRGWKTRSMECGPLRSRLERTLERVQLRYRDIVIWATNRGSANAAISTSPGPWRDIFLTEPLIAQLTEPQLEAVALHEAAHAKRGHILFRIAALAFAPAILLAARETFAPLGMSWINYLATIGIPVSIQLGVLLPIVACGYAAVALRVTSICLEHDADLFAALHMEGEEQMSAALLTLTPKGEEHRSWLYPSVTNRVRWVKWAVDNRDLAKLFQRRVSVAGWSLVVLVASLMAWSAVQ